MHVAQLKYSITKFKIVFQEHLITFFILLTIELSKTFFQSL